MHIFFHCIVQLKILITFNDVISQLRFSILHSSSHSCSCLLLPRHFWKLLHHSFNSFLGLVFPLLGLIAQMQSTFMQPLVPDHHSFCITIVLHCFLGTTPTVLCKLSQCLHRYSSTIASKLRVFDILWARYIMHFLFLQTRSPLQCETF